MIERIFYETRPFVYIGGAVSAHSFNPNAFTNTFAVLLTACMACVLYWRYQYRYGSERPVVARKRR